MSDEATIEAKLEAAVQAESSPAQEPTTPEVKPTATPATTQAPSTESGKETSKSDVPYNRFSEVNTAKNVAEEALKEWENKGTEWQTLQNELQTQVTGLQESEDVLERIRSLHTDPDFKDIVEALDQKLKGENVTVPQVPAAEGGATLATASETKTATDAKLFEQTKSELEILKEETRAELMFDAANTMASQLLDGLPDTYSEADKQRIAADWTPLVDWENISENGPSGIRSEIGSTFQKAVTAYGEPQGALQAKINELEAKTTTKEGQEVPVSDEDYIKSLLNDEKWNKLEIDKDTGEASYGASDQEFSSALAAAMRRTDR